MEEPLYGFIVEVTVSENQTCQVFMSSDENNIPQCQLFREDEKEIAAGISTKSVPYSLQVDSVSSLHVSDDCSSDGCQYDDFDRQGNTGLSASRPQCRFSQS